MLYEGEVYEEEIQTIETATGIIQTSALSFRGCIKTQLNINCDLVNPLGYTISFGASCFSSSISA